MWSTCCCSRSSSVCHLKQVVASKTKFGYGPANSQPDRRRWLTKTQTGTWTDGVSFLLVTQINRLSGEEATVSSSGLPIPAGRTGLSPFVQAGGAGTTSLTDTEWVYDTQDGFDAQGNPRYFHYVEQISDEYTDDLLFSDAVALLDLTGGWANIPIDTQKTVQYDASGNAQSVSESPFGPVPCLLPQPGGDPTLVQFAGISGYTDSRGRPYITLSWSRFYTNNVSCLMHFVTDPGFNPPLPTLPNTCSSIGPSVDTNPPDPYGEFLLIGPINLIILDNVRFYDAGLLLLTPYTNPNRSLGNELIWTCNCDNPAP